MTQKLPILQIDAFTRKPYGGNPCAVVFGAESLSSEAMQAIALENNLSETAFVLPSEDADIRARYFTPSAEIPLAGHPTVATIHALVTGGHLPRDGDSMTFQLELHAGIIPIEVTDAQSDQPRISMSMPEPEFGELIDPKECLATFGLESRDLLPDTPAQVVSTGTPQLVFPLRDLDRLRDAVPDARAFASLRERFGFFSAHLFVLEGVTDKGATFARHFVPPPNPFEDPFTGSATGVMGAYLWHHRLIDQPTFIAEQGHWMNRPGEADVEIVGSPEAIQTVKVAGYACEVMRGEILVPNC